MKTLALAIILSLLSWNMLQAQQQHIGFTAGLNLANLSTSDDDDDATKILPAFMAGLVLDLDLKEDLAISTGLQYHGRGAASEDEDEGEIRMGYLVIPIHLLINKKGFIIDFGPYVAFPIGGTYDDGGDKVDINFGSSGSDDYSALDYGLDVKLGYQVNKLRLTAGYTIGLANGIPKDKRFFSNGNIHHSVITIAATYIFQ